MFKLGLQLTLRSGREAIIRLMVTGAAVAAGVAILLGVLADFHAFELTANRPNWEGTVATPARQRVAARTELWNYSDEVYQGQTIERLDVAALGPDAPVPPGLTKLPGPGQYYASPALRTLLRAVPRDQLGARFPGSLAGTIGDRALTGPQELVIYVGDAPRALASLPGTIKVSKIAATSGRQVWTHYFRDAFITAALAFLFPILILIGTATKLASARREERYASLRLTGATGHDINLIATVDAVLSGLLGAAGGIAIFAAVQPTLARTAITSAVYFPADVTPTVWGYLGVFIAVPAAAAITGLLALRRVRITPFGVSRKVTPPKPRLWRVLPLAAGVALFIAGMALTNAQRIGAATFPGLIIVMIGLVVAGPWLTWRAAELLPKLVRGAAPIFAARRLADNPKAAFRSVSGLVLAVFLGTLVGGLIPAAEATTTSTSRATALSNVLLDSFLAGPVCGNNVNCTGSGPTGPAASAPPSQLRMQLEGLPPGEGGKLLAGLTQFAGITTVPVYSLRSDASPDFRGTYTAVVGCAGMRALDALGQCPAGARAAKATAASLYGDNPMDTTEPLVGRTSPAVPDRFTGLYLQAVLIKVRGPAELEVVRTYLITHTRQSVSGTAARTFGEAVQARLGVANTVQRLIDVAVALTLIVAGCSLAVTVGGGLVERKRPFTMLRLTGTSTATLYRVVLAEAVLPLVAATVIAAGLAYGMSVLTVNRIAPPGTPVPVLDHVYYLTMGTGLAAAILVVLATLPLLGRITSLDQARFE
jgi:hypothetical protein